tara:strand:+ start:77 stop:670 length:594 start_codon:yes stop_codon:yes gene_type:complete
MATSRENRTISEFKSRLLGGGARPNLFEVELTAMPASVALPWQAERFGFLCKAAQLPGMNIANIDVPFRGRIFKVAGDRTIDNWTITVINDEDFLYRNAFEEWTQQIANLDDNMGSTNPSSYMVNAKVFQLGRGSELSSTNNGGTTNVVLKEYEFIDIFPINVGQIDVSYENTDTIEEYTVEFAVQSYKVKGAGTEG